ncbi:hypothetical protein ACFLX9_00170 [Chloroflexota bacterium]
MIEVEKRGKPAVLIVSGRFEGDAIASSRAFGMPDLRYVVVPRIYRNLDLENTIAQTEQVFDALVRELTTNVVEDSTTKTGVKAAEVERFEGEDQLDAFQIMNREFLNRDWGDGFPLMPATTQIVEEMLKGTNLPPDHVLCDLPPGYGLATVEKMAINAAMAGAQPDHMPVIIGALKAVSQMDPVRVKGFLMSTSSHASMLLVNGPIGKELDINAKAACMGPGRQNRANLAIGRAYTLCLKNIGYWYPGQMDMDTIGSTRKFSACLDENEEMSPWEPFHIEKGFKPKDSVVTVLATRGEVDVADQGNYTAEGLLKTIAYNAIFCQWNLATIHESLRSSWDTIVLVPPDVARPVAAGGFSKRAAKEFIHHHARFSLGKMKHYHPLKPETVAPQWRWLMDLSEKELNDIWMPVRESADRYQLICVGADRAKPVIIPSSPVCPESVNVDQYRSDR